MDGQHYAKSLAKNFTLKVLGLDQIEVNTKHVSHITKTISEHTTVDQLNFHDICPTILDHNRDSDDDELNADEIDANGNYDGIDDDGIDDEIYDCIDDDEIDDGIDDDEIDDDEINDDEINEINENYDSDSDVDADLTVDLSQEMPRHCRVLNIEVVNIHYYMLCMLANNKKFKKLSLSVYGSHDERHIISHVTDNDVLTKLELVMITYKFSLRTLSLALGSYTKLKSLILYNVPINDDGLELFADFLNTNKTIKLLDINIPHNQNLKLLGEKLSMVLENNTSLTSLHLYFRRANAIFFEEMSRGLKINATLQELHIFCSSMTQSIIEHILKRVKNNVTINKLCFDPTIDINIETEKITELLENNYAITDFDSDFFDKRTGEECQNIHHAITKILDRNKEIKNSIRFIIIKPVPDNL